MLSEDERRESRERAAGALKNAFSERNLALYLGAGVSVMSGIPTWEKLVSAMYFSALSDDSHQHAVRHAYRNYLMAIAEWNLRQNAEPLDITAQRIYGYYRTIGTSFRASLHDTLYMALESGGAGPTDQAVLRHLSKNRTLTAVAELCAPKSGTPGARAVVTYNYDDLLERLLEARGLSFRSVWKPKQRLGTATLPIYHVHGYVPYRRNGGSAARDLVFTEAQYHATANDPYHWSNLVQIKTMSNYVGLMIGMSMTDRNVRRILAALSNTPVRSKIYIVLQAPAETVLKAAEVAKISRDAKEHLERFSQSAGMKEFRKLSGIKRRAVGMKSLRKSRGRGKRTAEHEQVETILDAVKVQDFEVQDRIFRRMGVIPIWIETFDEIPDLVAHVCG